MPKILVCTQQHVLILEKLLEKFYPHIMLGFYCTPNSYGAMISTDAIDGSKSAVAPHIIDRSKLMLLR